MRFRVVPVLSRNTESLRKVIVDNVKNHTIIYTDGWSSYPKAINKCKELNKCEHIIEDHSAG